MTLPYSEAGVRLFHRNVDVYIQEYTVPQPFRSLSDGKFVLVRLNVSVLIICTPPYLDFCDVMSVETGLTQRTGGVAEGC
jgi:hypothetical protein